MPSSAWSSQILPLFEPFIPILLLSSPVIYTTWQAFNTRHTASSQPSTTPTRYHNVILGLVAINITVLMYDLVLNPPFNVFVHFGLPIDVSPEMLRKALLSKDAVDATLSMYTSTNILSNKLGQSMDNRMLYARFGHGVFSSGWSKTIDEYMLTTITTRILWSYVVQLVFMNAVMLIGGGQGRWRKVGTWIEGVFFFLEGYTRFAFHLGDGKNDVLQLDHRLFQLRTILHLILTLSLLYLPRTSTVPTPIPTSLRNLLQHLQTARSMTSLSTLARKATIRNATLRSRVIEKGERDERLARVARNSSIVREASAGFGWIEDDRAEGSVDEELVRGGLREKMRRDVEVGWELMVALSENRRRRIREMDGLR